VKKWAGWPTFFVALTDRASDTELSGRIYNTMRNSELEGLVVPEIETLGFECVKLEVAGSSRSPVLRLYIDKPGGVCVADCSLVSRTIGILLEEQDPFSGRYLLEVSSPGNNRPLVTAEHYQRFAGESANVQMRDGSQKITYTGRICSCNGGLLILEIDDGETVEIELEKVLKAHLVGREYKIDKKQKQARREKRAKRSEKTERTEKNKGDQK
jgi:ribosome maturation factor RimP